MSPSLRAAILSTTLLAVPFAEARAQSCIDAGTFPGADMGAKINAAAATIAADGCIAIPPGTHSGIATPVNLGTKRITLRGAGQAATRLLFTPAIGAPAISISQGGQPLQDVHRFELADFTIVNGSTTQDTISVAGVQGSPALVHNVAIHGGRHALAISNCNSNGFRDLTIYDPYFDGIYNDVTITGDNYFSNVTIISLTRLARAGVHMEATLNAGAGGGPYLSNVKVYGSFEYGFLLENSSGFRNDIYAFLTTSVADSDYTQGAMVFRNVRNVRITQSWAVNHNSGSGSAAWKFDNSGVAELSDSIAYSAGQGDVALVNGSSDIGISDSTLSGPVRHFYLDATTPPTRIHYDNLQLLSGTSALSNSASLLEQATALQSGVQSSGGFITGGLQLQSNSGRAHLLVEEKGTPAAARELAELRNNGGSVLILEDTTVPQRWAIGTQGNNLVIDNQANGAGPEFTFGPTGNFSAIGTKSFVHADPAAEGRFLRYVALEGPEVGVFTRGSARTEGGVAHVKLPGYFGRVVEPGTLTVQLTATGTAVSLFVVSKNESELVVRTATGEEAAFDYLVHGVRKSYRDFQVEGRDPADE